MMCRIVIFFRICCMMRWMMKSRYLVIFVKSCCIREGMIGGVSIRYNINEDDELKGINRSLSAPCRAGFLSNLEKNRGRPLLKGVFIPDHIPIGSIRQPLGITRRGNRKGLIWVITTLRVRIFRGKIGQ
jgi:hypothetical protein